MKKILIILFLFSLSTHIFGQRNQHDFLPPYIKDRIDTYNKLAEQNKESSFSERYGTPSAKVYIYGLINKEDFIEICYLNDKKGKPKNILVGAMKKKGNAVYILSPNSRISKEQEEIYPL